MLREQNNNKMVQHNQHEWNKKKTEQTGSFQKHIPF